MQADFDPIESPTSLHWRFTMKTEKRIIEIRAAEGGEDARLFVADLAQAYIRLANREG